MEMGMTSNIIVIIIIITLILMQSRFVVQGLRQQPCDQQK